MNSVKSLCSKAIIKADLKRYWWTGAIYSILIFLFSVYPFLERFWENSEGNNVSFFDSRFCNYSEAVLFATVIMPVVIGVFLFSYLQKSAPSTTAHAYPVKRTGLYVSHIISGLILISGAILINSVILTLCRSNECIYMMCSLKFILTWTLLTLLYSIVTFSLSVLCSTVTGSTAAAFVLTYIIGALPAFVELIITTIAHACLKGFYNEGGELFVDKLYFVMHNIGDNYGFGIWIYIIISLIAFLLGLAFYKNRHLENHTSVLSFKSLKPVLIYSFGICLGFIGYLYTTSFIRYDFYQQRDNLIIMLPFGIIGIIIAKMLIALSFRPKGIIKPIIIYTVFVFAFIGFFKFDISGFEKRVPSPDNIEYVSLSREHEYRSYRYVNGERLTRKDNFIPTLENPDAIKQVVQMHSALTDYECRENTYTRSIYINYKLKNGKSLQREYHVNDDFDGQKALFDNIEYKKTIFKTLQNDMNISQMNVRASIFQNVYIPDSDMQKRILEALKKDAMLVTYDEYFKHTQDIGLTIQLNTEYEAIDSSGNKSEHPITDSIHLKLYKSSVNTIALMKELDITSRAIEKIKGLNIGEKVITDPVKTRFITEKLLFEINDTTDYEKTILRETASITETTDAKVSADTVKKGTYDGYGCTVDIWIDNSYHSPYIKCTQEEYNWLIS